MTQAATPATITLHPQALQAFFTVLQQFPDFVDGMNTGEIAFYDQYEPGYPLTREEIREEVEEILSLDNLRAMQIDVERHHFQISEPMLWLLGFALREVHESYVSQPC